jgi:hypothetical protein
VAHPVTHETLGLLNVHCLAGTMCVKNIVETGMNVTQLRANIFKVFEGIDKTGQPMEVRLKGKRFRISPFERHDKFANLDPHPDCLVGDPAELNHIDWLEKWRQ